MKITWYGHACFLVETAEGSAVLDPYSPGSVPGLRLPALTADLVLCSHEHGDHNWRDGVTLTGRNAALSVSRLDTWHDEVGGLRRGANAVTVLEAEGLRVIHMGDLGHMLSAKQLEQLGTVDVLLLPVGGFYTIGPETAWDLARAIRPKILVPMHYRGAGFGFDVLSPVEDFLALAENVRRLDGNVLEPDKLTTPVTAVLRCPVEA